MKKIRNTRELRQSLNRSSCEFRLCLKGGTFSRKTIIPTEDGRFEVFNGIDEDRQILTGREFYTQSNIGTGMRYGAFWAEGE